MVSEMAKNFQKVELYILTSQFIRAAYSISLNIAEGSGQSNQVSNRFLGYSAVEYDILYKKYQELFVKINTFRESTSRN